MPTDLPKKCHNDGDLAEASLMRAEYPMLCRNIIPITDKNAATHRRRSIPTPTSEPPPPSKPGKTFPQSPFHPRNSPSSIPESLLQLAGAHWRRSKASCNSQEPIGDARKLPATCRSPSSMPESLLQLAGAHRLCSKASCKLQRLIFPHHIIPEYRGGGLASCQSRLTVRLACP